MRVCLGGGRYVKRAKNASAEVMTKSVSALIWMDGSASVGYLSRTERLER
jgi:hypothetical protein